MVTDTALVLGAGGITGVAWQLGLIVGLRDAGVDVTGADLLVGTSAGSVTGALLAAGVDPAGAQGMAAVDDLPIRPDWFLGMQAFALLNDAGQPPEANRAGLGKLALAADVGAEEPYVEALSRRLPGHDWPERALVITAVDTADGRPVVWNSASGVPLNRAVAASCAVPCVFPPVTVNGSRYMDGGVRSYINADLAGNAKSVVVLAPSTPAGGSRPLPPVSSRAAGSCRPSRGCGRDFCRTAGIISRS